MTNSVTTDALATLRVERVLQAGYTIQSQKSEGWFLVSVMREKGKPYVGTGYTFPEALGEVLRQIPDCLWIAGNLENDYASAAAHVRELSTTVIPETERAA